MKMKAVNVAFMFFIFIVCSLCFGCDLLNPNTKTEEQIELEKLVTDIRVLESISKNYNENEFCKRTLIYVRSEKYASEYWNALGGTLESDFKNFITNQSKGNGLSYLQTKEFYKDVATKQNIDFLHCFATMNLEIINSTLGDLGGFGGDICQLVKELKQLNISDVEQLKQIAKSKFNGKSSFGSEDLLADIDAVNIIKIYNGLSENNKTIANSMHIYYSNLTQDKRLKQFNQNLFGDEIGLSLDEKCNYLYTRLKNNYSISYLCSTYGISFTDNYSEFKICIDLFISYILNID